MLKFPCLVLDHDDTVVQSETTINYPFFCQVLDQYRPGVKMTEKEYTEGCFHMGFVNMCRSYYDFTDDELDREYRSWLAYIKDHIPEYFPGIERIIRRQKQEGGLVYVVSQSGSEVIARDYDHHFHMQPDGIYSWDLPKEKRKPSPWPLRDIMVRHGLSPEKLLVVDDMKPAWEMARSAGVAIAYAGWSRPDHPQINAEMERLCDYFFPSTEELEKFLFD